MLKKNLITGLGFAATLVTMGATLLSDWVDEKKMREMVKEEVDEALAEREHEEDEES